MLARFPTSLEMIMKRALLAVLTATVLATAACTGSDAPAPADPASSAPPAQTAPSPEASPATFDCLTGSYRLTRFVGVGDKATYGTGEGGNVMATFDDGTYELTSDGKDPIALTLAGQQGKLAIDGSVDGKVTGDGPQLKFSVGKSEGTATLSAGSQQRTLTMAEVASVLAPSGTGTLACGDNKAVVLLSDIRLELER